MIRRASLMVLWPRSLPWDPLWGLGQHSGEERGVEAQGLWRIYKIVIFRLKHVTISRYYQ